MNTFLPARAVFIPPEEERETTCPTTLQAKYHRRFGASGARQRSADTSQENSKWSARTPPAPGRMLRSTYTRRLLTFPTWPRSRVVANVQIEPTLGCAYFLSNGHDTALSGCRRCCGGKADSAYSHRIPPTQQVNNINVQVNTHNVAIPTQMHLTATSNPTTLTTVPTWLGKTQVQATILPCCRGWSCGSERRCGDRFRQTPRARPGPPGPTCSVGSSAGSLRSAQSENDSSIEGASQHLLLVCCRTSAALQIHLCNFFVGK